MKELTKEELKRQDEVMDAIVEFVKKMIPSAATSNGDITEAAWEEAGYIRDTLVSIAVAHGCKEGDFYPFVS